MKNDKFGEEVEKTSRLTVSQTAYSSYAIFEKESK
jgi:hypothetical protein